MEARFDIRRDDLTSQEIAALLREHLEFAARYSPPESVHALDIDKLRAPEVTFWSVWEHGTLVGCGALKDLGSGHVEVKSMRTADGHQRKGVARALLSHMLAVARERGYERVSLETGCVRTGARALRRLRFRAVRAIRRILLGSQQRVHDA